MKKNILLIVGSLAVIVLLGVIVYFANPFVLGIVAGSDEALQDNADLNPEAKIIPDAENAYFLFEDLGKTIPSEPNGGLLFEYASMDREPEWDTTKAQKLIDSNANYSRATTEALALNKYQDPLYANPEQLDIFAGQTQEFYPGSQMRYGSNLLLVEAKQNLKNSNSETAIDKAMASFQLGVMLTENNGSLLDMLIGTSIQTNSLKMLQRILAASGTTAGQKEYTVQTLKKFEERPANFAQTVKLAYVMDIRFIDQIQTESYWQKAVQSGIIDSSASGSEWKTAQSFRNNKYYFKPNTTKNLYTKYSRSLVEDFANPCNPTTNFNEITQIGTPKLFKSNLIGGLFLEMHMTGYEGVFPKVCAEKTLYNELIN